MMDHSQRASIACPFVVVVAFLINLFILIGG